MADTNNPSQPRVPRPARNRTRLREFQAALSERLREARSMPATQNRLALRIGQGGVERNFLIDLPEAGEIISVPDITPVPLTKPWYRGVANVRGNLVSVVDLSQFESRIPTTIDKDSRVLAFSNDLKFNAGILVTRMLGLRNAAQLTPAERDDDVLRPEWIGAAYRDADGGLWEELRLAALAADERFLQIGIW